MAIKMEKYGSSIYIDKHKILLSGVACLLLFVKYTSADDATFWLFAHP